jgi:glycosyltransferase involved in cell wall biosynthesis
MDATEGRERRVIAGHESRNDGSEPSSGLDLSVVIPIYNEEENIRALHERLLEALGKLDRGYEIIYVDDGSTDGSPQILTELAQATHAVRAIVFRRNFGQTAALQAGIEHSVGDVLVFLDGDLQNDPADIGVLLDALAEGYDVVSGWRCERRDSWTRTLPSRFANGLISWVTGVHLHDYGCTLKAYRREVLQYVKLYGEMHRFIPAVASWAGASITEVPVRHHPRRFGRSKYGISRTFRVMLDLITVKLLGSYSTKPIYLFGFVGLVLWVMAILSFLIVVIQKLLPPYPWAHNNPLLLLSVFLAIVGMQFVLMGLLAELTIRTYHESQGKPTYVIRRIAQSRGPESQPDRRPTATPTGVR